jgi:hypothetical protein
MDREWNHELFWGPNIDHASAKGRGRRLIVGRIVRARTYDPAGGLENNSSELCTADCELQRSSPG